MELAVLAAEAEALELGDLVAQGLSGLAAALGVEVDHGSLASLASNPPRIVHSRAS